MIEQMVADMGKRWAEIARRLRGRSDNAVKNWWNGGLNRRRRSNNHRRTELELRQQVNSDGPMHQLPPPAMHQHAGPPGYSHQPVASQQFYGHPIYHPNHMPHPQHLSMSSNGSMYRQSGIFDTPLPSPSAFSQLSADGAPSLVSDCSSVSGRSPHHGTSPIELPPLSGGRNDRRHSSAPNLRPGSYVTDTEFNVPPIPAKHSQQMLQEAFVPQQQPAFPPPTQYLPSQPRQVPQLPQAAMPQHFQTHNPILRGNYPPQMTLPSTSASSVQLPSISNLSVSDSIQRRPSSFFMDPNLQVNTPSLPTMGTPEGSPRDKMRLSNLTH